MKGETVRHAVAAALALVALAGGAAEGDAWLTFETEGPDAYADGTAVLDGECYALVWTANESFGGLSVDGTPSVAGDRLIVAAPVARGGRCPETIFQVSRKTAADLAGGTFGVALLDTRVVSAGGATNLAARAGGVPATLNGWGAAAGRVALNAPGETGADGAAVAPGAVAGRLASVPAGVAQPRILDIRLEGENVLLTVENRGGYVRAQGGPDVSADAMTGLAQAAPPDGEPVVIILPKQGDSGFFKAVGN